MRNGWKNGKNTLKKNFCLLNYDDYKKNNYMYFQKIFDYLEIDRHKIKPILNHHLKIQKLLSKKTLKLNLKQNIYSRTYNFKSQSVRNIIKKDIDTINFFNNNVKYLYNKFNIN